MYYITSGDCVIKMVGHDKKIHQIIRLLVEGDHFGEIACIYKCLRSATVVSRNYNTLASLTSQRYKMVISEYPMFKHEMINHTFKYKDPRKTFLLKIIDQLPFT